MMKEAERAKVVDLTEMFNALSRDVISRAVIGETTRKMKWGDELRSIVSESSKLMGEFYIGDFMPWLGKIGWIVSGFERRVREAFESSDKLLEEIVKERKRKVEKMKEEGGDSKATNECFIDVLLTLDELKCEGVSFDDKSIKAIVKVIRFC